MKYITSDLHFSHNNILEHFPNTRKFESVGEMNRKLISEINSLPNCEMLYHVGDFFLGKNNELEIILSNISVPITFIFGNHDHRFFRKKILDYSSFSGTDYLELKINKTKICLFHYPLTEWNGAYRGSIHLHGHLHGTENPYKQPNSLDVGFDAHGRILSLDEAILMASSNCSGLYQNINPKLEINSHEQENMSQV